MQKRLFRRPYWIMLGMLVISILAIGFIALLNYKSSLLWIPSITIVLVSIGTQIPREKYLYKSLARAVEMSEQMQDYEQYVLKVWDILRNYDIDTPVKILKLKTECEITLKMHEDKFGKINSRIFDVLIAVPLGALVASIMYADSDTAPATIGALILIGLTILVIVKLIRYINYYSEGYFKDKYLLDAISELEYYENLGRSHLLEGDRK